MFSENEWKLVRLDEKPFAANALLKIRQVANKNKQQNPKQPQYVKT